LRGSSATSSHTIASLFSSSAQQRLTYHRRLHLLSTAHTPHGILFSHCGLSLANAANTTRVCDIWTFGDRPILLDNALCAAYHFYHYAHAYCAALLDVGPSQLRSASRRALPSSAIATNFTYYRYAFVPGRAWRQWRRCAARARRARQDTPATTHAHANAALPALPATYTTATYTPFFFYAPVPPRFCINRTPAGATTALPPFSRFAHILLHRTHNTRLHYHTPTLLRTTYRCAARVAGVNVAGLCSFVMVWCSVDASSCSVSVQWLGTDSSDKWLWRLDMYGGTIHH